MTMATVNAKGGCIGGTENSMDAALWRRPRSLAGTSSRAAMIGYLASGLFVEPSGRDAALAGHGTGRTYGHSGRPTGVVRAARLAGRACLQLYDSQANGEEKPMESSLAVRWRSALERILMPGSKQLTRCVGCNA